jgi:hypothetical protein
VAKATVSDQDFIDLFKNHGPTETARRLGIGVRRVYDRRQRLEGVIGAQITGPDHQGSTRHNISHAGRIELDVEDGIVVIGSDAHFWPDERTTAFRAYVKFCHEFAPKIRAKIMNGDVLDGASISRHPPIGWEKRPSLIQEIEACRDRLHEIEQAAPKARRLWTLGNHCARFATRLATVAPEFARVHGVALNDHFPNWESAWSCWINDGEAVVKHRHKNGIHATHNNTIWAGKTMVTGHLHSLKVTPFTDYNGTRWGVDTGCLANTDGPQFLDYTEDGPKNWRAGFAVLTFHRGELLWPELVCVRREEEGEVSFRGKVYTV